MMVHMFAKEIFLSVFLLPLMYMLVKEFLLAFFPFYCDILRSSHCWVGEQSLSFIPDANC